MSAAAALLDAYVAAEPADAGMAVAAMPPDEASRLMRDAPAGTVATLLQHMPTAAAARCLGTLPAGDVASVGEALPLEDLAALVRRCEPDVRSSILEVLPSDLAASVGTLLQAADGTAGAAMDPAVPVVQADATAEDLRDYLRDVHTRVSDYVYVVEADRSLIGVVNFDALAAAAAHTPVRQVTRDSLDWLRVEMPLEAVLAHPAWQRFDVLPVVDGDSRFMGVVRHRRLRQLTHTGPSATSDDSAMRTLMALGEVYWLGLCGLLQGLSSVASSPAAESRKGSR